MRKTDGSQRPGGVGRPRCPGKQAAILEAALALLAEEGFARMTLDQVARTAGVSKATIHLRWKTKADLAAAALAALPSCFSHVPAGTQGAGTAADDSLARVASVLADCAQTLTRHHAMALLGTCLSEEVHAPRLLELWREHLLLPRRTTLYAALRQAVADGALPGDADLEALTSALLGSLCADHLAGRTLPPDWARRTVDVLFGTGAVTGRSLSRRHPCP